MKWEKLGLVFRPDPAVPWMRSHAATPAALALSDGRQRVYFSSRDERQRSHVGFFDIDLGGSGDVLRVAERPVLEPGPLGFFDDHGVFGTSVVEHEGRVLLYYLGWNPGPRPLFYPSIGLAVSDDGGETFTRFSRAPILARSEVDPWMVSAPSVRHDDGQWRMYYISGIGWEGDRSFYDVKIARSDDGVRWKPTGDVAIALREGESNVARLNVTRRGDGYEGWYSYEAGQGYRIGYATSPDGESWERRDDEAGIDVSPGGWDSEAVAYPWLVPGDGADHLLYNGNGFGRDGIGLAVQRRG